MHPTAVGGPSQSGLRARTDRAMRGALQWRGGRRRVRTDRRARPRDPARRRPRRGACDHRQDVGSGGPGAVRAATWRDRLDAASRGIHSAAQLRVFGQLRQIVAATSRPGGWDIHVIRHGRLAGATFCPVGADPHAAVDAVVTAAEAVEPPSPPDTAALISESRMLLRWLEGARPIDINGCWALPMSLQRATDLDPGVEQGGRRPGVDRLGHLLDAFPHPRRGPRQGRPRPPMPPMPRRRIRDHHVAHRSARPANASRASSALRWRHRRPAAPTTESGPHRTSRG